MSQTSLTGEAGGYAPNSGAAPYDEIRPLSVRMRDSVRAQLDVLAQLNNRSVTEETRLALEHWVERAKTDPSLKERADRVRVEIDEEAEHRRRSIDRDAANRRHAIAAVLGVDDDWTEDDPYESDVSELDEDADREPETVDLTGPAEEPEETPEESTDAKNRPVPPDPSTKGARRATGRASGAKAAQSGGA